MLRSVSMLGALAILALLWGCGSDTVTKPAPAAPQVLHDGYVMLVQDTASARASHVVYLEFSWETDMSSTDVLLYGPRDSLRDSLVAENADASFNGVPVHVHQAPPSTAGRLRMGTGVEFFYQVRARSKDATAPLGYSKVWRFKTFDPSYNGPVQVRASLWRGAAGR